MLAEADELLGELPDRQAIVDDARVDRAPRHPAELGRRRLLGERDAARLLDGLEPLRAVGCRPREDDADRPAPSLGSEGTQEEVDGQVLRLRVVRPWLQREQPASEAKARVRRDDVDVAGLDAHALGGLLHGHLRRLGQSLAQEARVRRVQMLDQHERHPGVPGADVTEETRKRL